MVDSAEPGGSGHIRLQLSKLSRDVVADQVRVEAQHLTELDPGGAELTQGSTEPLPRGQDRKIRIHNMSNKGGATSGAGSGSSVVGQPREPVPGEDVSNLCDAISVADEHPGNVVGHVRFSILAHHMAPLAGPLDTGDRRQRTGGCQGVGMQSDLAAELIYVPAILACSSA